MLRTRVVLSLLVAATLGGLALGRQPAGDGDPAGHPFAVRRAHAQAGGVAATNVQLTLFDNVITWKTTPSTQVRAELRSGAQLQLRSAGQAVSNEAGVVTFNLGGGGPGGGGGGGNANIRPGDTIRLIPQGGVTATLMVPTFAAGINVDGNTVVGNAPAGASLEVVLVHAGGTVTRTVGASAAGTYSLAFPEAADLVPGDHGSVKLALADGNTIWAEYAALMATSSLNARQASGDATPGDQVSVGIRGAGGASKGTRTTTVQGGGTDWAVGGGGGGPGGGGPNAFGPLVAGDTFTVSVRSALPGASRYVEGVVPALTMQVDAATRRVRGTAPAGMAVEIEAQSPSGAVFRAMASADPGGAPGAFVADMSAAVGIGPGWRVSAIVTIAPGLKVRMLDAIEQVRIGVHTNVVNGVADPGRTITVTVKAADGTQKGQQDTDANNAGTYNVNFGGGGGGPGGGGQAVDFEVGDIVEVEFIRGDPVTIAIPPFTAKTDPATNMISGVAPAGSTVTVTQGGGQNQRTVTAQAGAGGQYQADFTGQADIEPPMGGGVTARLASGHELFSTWAAVRMTMEIGDNYVSGNGPAGREVSASLVDSNITVNVAAGEDDVGGGGGPGGGGGGGGQWQVQFEDTLSQPVNIRVGDRVRATVGDDTFEVRVPELSGVAFVADDLINGKTTPNRTLSLTVQRLLGADSQAVEVTSDANGNFSHSFSGTFDVQFNDVIIFTTREQGHNIISRMTVPGLRLNLDEARLTGSWLPNVALSAALVSGGRTTTVNAQTGADATFALVFESGGQRPTIAAGDVVTVRMPSKPGEELRLVVPELTVNGNLDANTAGGRATPGGVLRLTVQDAFPRGGGFGPGGGGPGGGGQPGTGQRQVNSVTINADGTWSTGFQPQYDVAPGTRMFALYREPSGHLVERIRYVPIANVQHGGGKVCGYAAPRDAVEASMTDAGGATLATARGQAGYNSSFDLTLNGADQLPIQSAAGQTAKVKLGAAAADVALPEISAAVTWGQPQITVTAPANTPFWVLRPAQSCLEPAQGLVFRGQTNAQGQANANVGFGIDPGEGFELAFFTSGGHRFYRHVFRSLGRVYVATDKVTGRATPLSAVTVVLRASDGSERARATTKASSDGEFEVRFRSGTSPVNIQPTDVVHLEASGEAPDIAVEKLAFDWSKGDPIVLEAAPNRDVVLSIALANQPAVTFGVTTDEQGRWRFEAADIPPRAGWTLDDITGVRAVITTANEHLIISETGDTPVTPPPPTGRPRVFIPLTLKNRGLGR